jgi:hypothetical protein
VLAVLAFPADFLAAAVLGFDGAVDADATVMPTSAPTGAAIEIGSAGGVERLDLNFDAGFVLERERCLL